MNMRDIAARLERRFGAGESAGVRRKFFQRLERLVEVHGEPAYRIIAEAFVDSSTADNPARWFCATVKRRLVEQGLWWTGEPPDF